MTTLSSAKALWYLTRGTGVVALLLLTTSLALGILTSVRWRSARWPRFAVSGLHRNLTLLSIAFVAVHVVTTVLDGYAPIRLVDAVVPFVSQYRPLWLGLGALAFDLLLALVLTSLVRARIGYGRWRAVHWLAYASWPVALVHALGTGSDARVGFLMAAAFGSLAVVILAVLVRAALAHGGSRVVRVGAIGTALAAPVALGAWYTSGPGHAGWARRAGTPASLLSRAAAARAAAHPVLTSASAPPDSTAALRGRIRESTSPGGAVTVVISGRLNRGRAGAIRIDLRGQPVGGGVAMTASGVSFVQAGRTLYRGSVTTLEGSDLAAVVTSAGGTRAQLVCRLVIDLHAHTVGGTVTASKVPTE